MSTYKELLQHLTVNGLFPVGIEDLSTEFGEIGPHFVFLLKVSQDDLDFRRAVSVKPFITFMPTKYYPNLWCRVRIDDGTKISDEHPSYFYCEYNFNILAEYHRQVLDDIIRADRYTMVYADPLVTQISYFHFEITDKVKADLSDEIAACKNGVALYNHKDLNDESFLQGQMEIDKAYDVSGEHINIELVKTISWQRLGVRPFPRENRIRIIDGSRYLDL